MIDFVTAPNVPINAHHGLRFEPRLKHRQTPAGSAPTTFSAQIVPKLRGHSAHRAAERLSVYVVPLPDGVALTAWDLLYVPSIAPPLVGSSPSLRREASDVLSAPSNRLFVRQKRDTRDCSGGREALDLVRAPSTAPLLRNRGLAESEGPVAMESRRPSASRRSNGGLPAEGARRISRTKTAVVGSLR